MALEKAHDSNKKMSFGEHRDIDKLVSNPVLSTRTKRVNVNFDEDKHKRLKTACVKNETTITDVINQLVDNWLHDNE